jgi:hypothetical protein
MKKRIYIILAVIFAASIFAGCDANYKKGVDYNGFPDRKIPIYDDAIVFMYHDEGGEWKLQYGTDDDVDDVMDFYREEFEDPDYTITKEKEKKDKYSVDGAIDEYEFEIDVEEASGDAEKYFDTVVEIKVEDTGYDEKDKEDAKDEEKNTKNDVPDEKDIKIINSALGTNPAEGTGVVGELDTLGAEAEFDSTAFDADAQISISEAKSSDFPKPDESRFELAETGYDFKLEGADYYRPNGKVTVTFKLSQDMVDSLEDEGFLQIAYYFEGKWYLMHPESVDLEQKTASVGLFHFSWGFPVKLTKEEIRDQKAGELAEKKFNDQYNLGQISSQGKTDIEKMISEVTGVTDTAALNAIAEYMMNENDFTSLALADNKGDMTGFSTKMAEVVAKSINEAAMIGENATLISGAFQAAGYIWEGDAQGAAESVANALLDSTAYGKLIKLTITVTDASIKSWKANGIEEMFQAYKNGADDGWFGYHVEKGNFDEALQQSAAIQRQIEIDAVKAYCNAHGKKEGELTSGELADIKSKAISELEEKFKARIEKEAQIEKDKEYYKKLLNTFEKNGVDDSVTIRVDMMDALTYEQRMESYVRVADKIIELTGGKKIEFDGLVDDTEIPAHVVTTAIKKWYGENGEKEAKDYLREQGYISAPSAESLAGIWSGTTTMTEIYVDESILQSIQESVPEESDEGCDQNMIAQALSQLDQMEGQSEDVAYTITTSGNTIYMSSDDGDTMSFAYDPKTGYMTPLDMGSSSEGYDMSASMSVNDTNPLTMNGTISATSQEQVQEGVTLPAGMIRFTVSMSLTKTG